MKVVGIDAGVSGAVALYNTATTELEIYDIELDGFRRLNAKWLFDLLLEWEPDTLATEDTFRPKSLIHQTGGIVAVAQILEIPYRLVAVTTWKKAVLGENTSDKEKSINKCKELFPKQVNLLRKPRARTDSPDRAEAVLIAYYLTKIA